MLRRKLTCAPKVGLLCPEGRADVSVWGGESKSVIRVQNDFALPPCRLAVAFVPGVARYAGDKAAEKMPVAGRKGLESRGKTIRHTARRSNDRFGLNTSAFFVCLPRK